MQRAGEQEQRCQQLERELAAQQEAYAQLARAAGQAEGELLSVRRQLGRIQARRQELQVC